MGFFDRLREKLRGSTPSPPEPESVLLPPGHQVQVYGPAAEPGLRQTLGGVLIADLGLGDDELPEAVDSVVDQLEQKVSQGARALLAISAGSLDDLFAPAQVEAMPAVVVVWYISPQNLAHWLADQVYLERQLGRLQNLGKAQELPVTQLVVVLAKSAQANLLKGILAGIGIESRIPAADGVVVVEVMRPEGTILAALTGTTEDVKPRKGTAQELCRAAAGVFDAHAPVLYASRLRRILREEATGKVSRLDQELLGRTRPFLLLANPHTGQIGPHVFEGIEAYAAFPDFEFVYWAAADLGIAEPKIIGISAQDLVKVASAHGCCLAFNIYANRQTPEYVLRRLDEVERLRRSFDGRS